MQDDSLDRHMHRVSEILSVSPSLHLSISPSPHLPISPSLFSLFPQNAYLIISLSLKFRIKNSITILIQNLDTLPFSIAGFFVCFAFLLVRAA